MSAGRVTKTPWSGAAPSPISNITQLTSELTISSPALKARTRSVRLQSQSNRINEYFSPLASSQHTAVEETEVNSDAHAESQRDRSQTSSARATHIIDHTSSLEDGPLGDDVSSGGSWREKVEAPIVDSAEVVMEVGPSCPNTQHQRVGSAEDSVVVPSAYSSQAVPGEPGSNNTKHQRPHDTQLSGQDEEDSSKFSLQNFFSPVLPNTCQTRDDGETVFVDDWHKIDSIHVNDCLLSITPAMQEVPNNHKHQFARAFEVCFQRFQDAAEQQNQRDIERALKWFLALPHMLLASPPRGGKAGQQLVKRRFDCIVAEDYGRLIEIFKSDREVVTLKNEKRKNIVSQRQGGEDPEKKTRNAISLISRGLISKAANRMTSFGVVNINDPVSKAALKSKYPSRGRGMQTHVTKGTPVDNFNGLSGEFHNLKSGVAPGTGGMRPEFLVSLAEVWDEENSNSNAWDLVNYFCMQYVSGGMPPWFYQAVMTVETVGLFKTAERHKEKLRPIGMRNPFIKTIHKDIIKQNKRILKEFLEPQQLGMSVAGAAKLVHSIRMTLEKNPNFVCVKLDFRNAFNEISRARVVESLEEEESLAHLAQFAGMLLAPVSGLESGGQVWGMAAEGTTQGDPLSGPFFCVSIHKDVRIADSSLSRAGGMVRCGWDDGYFVGPEKEVFETLETFSTEVQRRSGLVLQVTKSEVYTHSGVMPPDAPAGFVNAGLKRENHFHPGFLCYGVPMGSDEYVVSMLDLKLDELEEEVKKILTVLEDSRQSMWAMLRSSFAQKLDYWLTLVYPSLVRRAAERMDKLELMVVQSLLGIPIPMGQDELDWNMVINVPVDNISGRSFQNWVLRLPVRLGGMGLRSNVETSPAAFIGGLEQSLPHFTKGVRICPELEDQIGNFENVSSRWTTLIGSGCRTGNEFMAAWNSMKTEAEQCSRFLNSANTLQANIIDHTSSIEDGPLSDDVGGAGCGREDGGTRKLIVNQREELRAAVLGETLSRLKAPHNTSRPVMAWTNRDKLSTAWLQSLPGPNGLNNAEFSEAMALVLCTPSPACQDRVGEKVGKSVVDKYGNAVMNEPLPGDHWRVRHDTVKMAINSLCSWARLPATAEVWGLFSHLIPSEALSRFESGRKRQGMVPDFRFKIPSEHGETQVKLAELKLISCCPTWYTPAVRSKVRATDKRAQGLQKLYRDKAKALDQTISGSERGQRGPVERRLDEFGEILGLCFGAWGEASQDVHSLVEVLAQSRLKFQVLQEGRPNGGSEQELAVIVSQIRRLLSVTAVKAQVGCLLGRLHQVGPGNKQLAKKREWALLQDNRMKRERHSQWIRKIEGVNTLRKGMIKVA